MALLVGEKDDIEAIQITDVYPSSFENENVTLAHAQSRAGISPAIAGSGGGGPQKKTGSYSSAGTLATMQESNSRVNLDASDFRHAHVKLGSLLTAMYAKYGVGDRAKMFGLMSSPMIQPEVKDYMVKTVRSLDRFIKRVMKDFQYDQPEQYVPEPKLPDFSEGQGGKNPPSPPGGQMAPSPSSIQSTAAATPGRGPANVPAPGVAGVGGGTPPPVGTGGGGPQV
jgi:hypothetical protein